MPDSNPRGRLQVETARASAEDAAPIVWMLGALGAGQTALMTSLALGWADLREPSLVFATSTAEQFAHPRELPLVRFLLTHPLAPDAAYDPQEDMALVSRAPALVLVTVAAGEQVSANLMLTLRHLRITQPEWPVIVAQTRLHELYPAGQGHPPSSPYDAAGQPSEAVPLDLQEALLMQRATFGALADCFVPIDITEGSGALDPPDFGLSALRAAMLELAPELVPGLALHPDAEEHVWRQVILPWAAAAGAVDAPPLPILGGMPAIAMQAAMVRAIARRFAVEDDAAVWSGLLAALGTGFVLRYGLGWMVRQVLKLAPFWGGAAVAAWTFAVSCGIGAAAIRFCRSEAEGQRPSREELHAAFAVGSLRAPRQGDVRAG